MLMLYSSTVIGPAGLNFVPLPPAQAFWQLLDARFISHGSDQRADWVGNLLMLVPFGFLATGAIHPASRAWRPVLAMLACTAVILAIKYLQLFFPPRTVSLNYIVAQCAGAAIGCSASAAWAATAQARWDPLAPLVLALRLYGVALLAFLLMPLDFAMDATDLWAQAARLPDTVRALPGGGRPIIVQAMVLLVGTAAFVPVGMALCFTKTATYQARRGPVKATLLGFALATGVFAVSTLVLGASPVLGSILYRTGGVAIGAVMLGWLARQDPVRLRRTLNNWLPWLAGPYLLVVLLANRLLSVHWLSPHAAIANAYPLGLVPLFDYYIVSKAAAAKNIVAHALLYMPVGIGLWLRGGKQRPWQAFLLAALLSLAVELARYLRPGLKGDINAVAVAGLAAVAAMRLMPAAWTMLAMLVREPGMARSGVAIGERWPEGAAALTPGAPVKILRPLPLGEIENL